MVVQGERIAGGFILITGNHSNAGALFAFYNLVRTHKTLRKPRHASGDSDRLWSVEDIVALIDTDEGAPKKRSPYKPHQPKVA
jgi:hypothetical protein